MQRDTVRSETSKPSLSKSPWMRGAPHVGFSATRVPPRSAARPMRSASADQVRGLGKSSQFRKTRDALAKHLKPETDWRHQLEEACSEPTFGRIMHRVHGLAHIGSGQSRTHDTDTRRNEETSAPLQNICINPSPEPLGLLSCQDRSALDGHALCQQDLIAYGNTGLPHKASRDDFGYHLPDQNRTIQSLGDFGMPAPERDIQFFTRSPDIGHDGLG